MRLHLRLVLPAACAAILAAAVPAFAAAADTPPAKAAPAQAAKPARLSIDTPIESIVADAQGKAVLERYFPGVDKHPHYPMFKAMSAKDIAPNVPGWTAETLAKLDADLAEIP